MNQDKTKTHLEIGVITRPHGIRGELKVRLHFEESTALEGIEFLVVEPGKGKAERMQVESVRGSSKGPILALLGVQGREAADALRGAKLWVQRAQAEPLAPGEYYLVDLVGCTLELDGDPIGEVSGVRPDPSVDTMVVRLNDGGVAEVPIVDAWIGEVDVQEKRVELISEDGLIR